MMIKYCLIISLIAALVPTAMMSNGSASATTERGLFSNESFESGDPGTLRITEIGGETKEMALKAENEDGDSKPVSDFEITADNVLSIDLNDEVRVHTDDNVEFTKALVTDSTEKKKTIDISDSGEISFNGYEQGVYVLNVVINDEFAFEAIIVIGPETQQVIKREVTRVNNKQVTDVDVEIIFTIDCGKDFHVDKDGLCVPDEPEPITSEPITPPVTPPITPIPEKPYCDEIDQSQPYGTCQEKPYCDEIDDSQPYGTCHDRKDYDENTGLYPCLDGSQEEDWRDCNGDTEAELTAEPEATPIPETEPTPEPGIYYDPSPELEDTEEPESEETEEIDEEEIEEEEPEPEPEEQIEIENENTESQEQE
jgi:hypothetical protein